MRWRTVGVGCFRGLDLVSNLRVMHVASGDLWAGAESLIANLIAEQRAQGTGVTAVVLNDGRLARELEEQEIDTVVVDEATTTASETLRRLHAIASQRKIHILHSHRSKENILVALASMRLACPSVRTVHGASEFVGRHRTLRRRVVDSLDWLAGRFCQRKVIAVSGLLRTELAKSYGQRRVVQIDNGLNIPVLRDAAGVERTPRSKMAGNARRAVRVGFVGRLVPVKRLDILLDVAKHCRNLRSSTAIEFNIFGDGPMKQWLVAEVAGSGLDKVRFHGFTHDIAARMAELDILLLVSDHEGQPMTVLEAMVLGVPVVARSVGGLPELLDGGRAGILVDSSSPLHIAERLVEVMDDHEYLAKIATAAAARAESLYSISVTARKYTDLYREILKVRESSVGAEG